MVVPNDIEGGDARFFRQLIERDVVQRLFGEEARGSIEHEPLLF